MSSSSSTSSTPSQTPPSDSHKSDLASALTLALRKRKIEASNTGDDSEKADAYQAKIDAYKKEKVVPKDAKKMQLEKLIEEIKQKHSKMFNAEDESNSSSSPSSDDSTPAKDESDAPKLESFTIPKTQLAQMNVIPRKAASPVRAPSTPASGETVTPKKIPLSYTKSQAPAPPSSNEPFSSKILMRSQSSTLKNIPEKRHTVHVSSFKEEEEGEGENTNPLQYWKKKDEAVKKPRPTPAVVAQTSLKTIATTILSFNTAPAFKKNPLAHTAVEIKSSNDSSAVQETVSVEIAEASEKHSASDLIRTFNASSSTLKKNSSSSSGGGGGGNVSNIYLNKLKPANTKPKAPQPEKSPAPAFSLPFLPSTTTIVEKTKPPVQVNWVPASTNTNRSSHLVKQQSWSERFGGGTNSSVVHISHSNGDPEESSAEEKNFQKRFSAKDNTSTDFKALFTTQKSQEETKPLVRIDSYSSSNSRPGPRKIDLLAAAPAAQSFQEEELQTSDVEGEGSSVGSGKVHIQNEQSHTLTRSNLRQRYSPDDSPVPSSDSDSDP